MPSRPSGSTSPICRLGRKHTHTHRAIDSITVTLELRGLLGLSWDVCVRGFDVKEISLGILEADRVKCDHVSTNHGIDYPYPCSRPRQSGSVVQQTAASAAGDEPPL